MYHLEAGTQLTIVLKHPESRAALLLLDPSGTVEQEGKPVGDKYLQIHDWPVKETGFYRIYMSGDVGNYYMILNVNFD